MADVHTLHETLKSYISDYAANSWIANDEVNLEVPVSTLIPVCHILRQKEELYFEQLIDLCGVDYLQYGIADWETTSATHTGFSRGVETNLPQQSFAKLRFAVVYHLLSLTNNHRIRLRCFAENNESPSMPSVVEIWAVANWFEREAYDLFGIDFENHPDLRRILTDYGFNGHPFRKDFPLIGEVEPRYDATLGRVINEPVSITPRTLVPKVIRKDHRYLDLAGGGDKHE